MGDYTQNSVNVENGDIATVSYKLGSREWQK
jgi:hypothetical protein